MAEFLIRIELHNLPLEHSTYDKLHSAMEALGCKRTIKAESGGTYHLPRAEYLYESITQTTPRQAYLHLRQAPDATNHPYGMMVAEWSHIVFSLSPTNALLSGFLQS